MSSDKWHRKHMKKKITVFTLCAVLFALSFPLEAQQQAKVAKIGWLQPGPAAPAAGSRVIPARVP